MQRGQGLSIVPPKKIFTCTGTIGDSAPVSGFAVPLTAPTTSLVQQVLTPPVATRIGRRCEEVAQPGAAAIRDFRGRRADDRRVVGAALIVTARVGERPVIEHVPQGGVLGPQLKSMRRL